MIDIREDKKNKKYYFIEINPRFPGSLQYHFYAGVNYVKLSIDAALKSEEINNFVSICNKKLFYRPLELFLSKLNLFLYKKYNK